MKCRDCRFSLACYAGNLGDYGLCPTCGRVFVNDDGDGMGFGTQIIFYCQELELTETMVSIYNGQVRENEKDGLLGCVLEYDPTSPLHETALGPKGVPQFEHASQIGPIHPGYLVVEECHHCRPVYTLPDQHTEELEPCDAARVPST